MNNQKGELQKTINMKEVFDKKETEFKKTSAELREQVIELREANVCIKFELNHFTKHKNNWVQQILNENKLEKM